MSESPDVDLAVRAAEESDAETLAVLMTELGYKTRTSEMQMRLETIGKDPRYRTFVAVRNGKVCGMIGTFWCHSYEHNNPGGRILALVVAHEARSRGVGRALIAAAENDFAQNNIRRIAVDTRFEREGAHKFYDSVGYTRNGFRFVKNLAAAAD
jgi:ribosomal protein S18 acetylase RimI-like enzyme